MIWMLSQSQSGRDAAGEVLWLLGVVVLLAVAVAVIIMVLRKRLLGGMDQPLMPSFSLSDLRKMRDDGTISPREYEVAREKLIRAGRALLDEPGDEASKFSPNAQTRPDKPVDHENFEDRPDNGDDPPPPSAPA